MASKNVIRQYVEGGYYHVYNRGVEKRIIFLDKSDYEVFLYYIFIYLAPKFIVLQRYPKLKVSLKRNNLSQEVKLVSYCLMPNHFHVLLKQESKNGISKLMKQLTNAYTRYFNNKYNRVGYLVQGVFKAVYIENDAYLLHLTRYIHRNPLSLPQFSDLETLKLYPWSSYGFYLNQDIIPFLDYSIITSNFSNTIPTLSYEDFVMQSTADNDVLPNELLIEDD